MHRLGKYTLITDSAPSIVASAGVVGKTEGEGPLANEFDRIFTDDLMGKDSFEQAESELQREAVERLLNALSVTKVILTVVIIAFSVITGAKY